ncbi:MAG: SusE domain-containing protein [Chitinophagaceae bacterium]|nr:SusE domain-containing protein [Chitinophagaceae bacterium]
MKAIIKIGSFFAGLALILGSCSKVEDLPSYASGKSPVLTASSATIAAVAADSNKTALTLNWTSAEYATDSTHMKYIVQIDSTGKNFTRAVSREITPGLNTSYTAKELNNILLGFGYAFNVPVDMEVRVISSYLNNNERLMSNVLKIKMTPYKVPPKVALPASGKLFIVGNATVGGWNNPVPTPAQELTRIDETTFGGIFQLDGGKEFLLLPVNGDWSHKFSVKDNTLPGLNSGGDFGYDLAQNFPGPATAGLYKITVDFQAGKFKVEAFTQQHGLPSALFIVGNATPGGWDNPVPVPAQQFTRINSTKFELASIALTANEYLLLPENGNWGKKYGVKDNTDASIKLGGTIVPEGQNFAAPAAGNYKITVDLFNNSYKLTKL